MRQIQITVAAALVMAVVAILGVTVINAKFSRHANVAPASSSVDVMQMMKNANDLPQERYDAY